MEGAVGRRIAGVLTLMLLGLSLWAQPQAQERMLVNGMRVVYIPDSTRHLLHMGLVLRGGGSLDPPDAQGLAHLYEHLFFQYLPDSTPAARSAERGMQLSHRTMLEGQFLGMSLPEDELPAALFLLRHGLDASGWTDSMLDVARAAMVPELQAQDDGPENHLANELRERLWGDDAGRKQPVGRYADILRLTSERVIAGTARARQPRHSLLVATGPMPAVDFLRQAEAAFGHWETADQGDIAPQVRFPELKGSVYFQSVNEFASQPLIMMAWPISDAAFGKGTDDRMRLFCTAAQLRRGAMHRALVDGGLATQFTWTYAGGINPGQLLLYVVPVEERLGECMARIHALLAGLAGPQGLEKGDILVARRLMALEDAMGFDHSIPRLMQLGDAWLRLEEGIELPSTADQLAELQELLRQVAGKQHVAGLLISSEDQFALRSDTSFVPPTGTVATAVTITGAQPELPVPLMDPATLHAQRVYFDGNLARPDTASLQGLEALAAMLRAHPDHRLFLNSYAEGLGDGVRNYQYSVVRAKAVRAILIEDYGVAPRQLVIRAYGEAFPEFPDDKDLRNRRLTFDYAPADAQDNAF